MWRGSVLHDGQTRIAEPNDERSDLAGRSSQAGTDIEGVVGTALERGDESFSDVGHEDQIERLPAVAINHGRPPCQHGTNEVRYRATDRLAGAVHGRQSQDCGATPGAPCPLPNASFLYKFDGAIWGGDVRRRILSDTFPSPSVYSYRAGEANEIDIGLLGHFEQVHGWEQIAPYLLRKPSPESGSSGKVIGEVDERITATQRLLKRGIVAGQRSGPGSQGRRVDQLADLGSSEWRRTKKLRASAGLEEFREKVGPNKTCPAGQRDATAG
jgi:hypothetical protein